MSLALHLGATVLTIYVLGRQAMNVALDVYDGETAKHWVPQAVALIITVAVLLLAIWL